MIIDFPKDGKTLLNYWEFGKNCYEIHALYDTTSDSFYSFDVIKNDQRIYTFKNREDCLAAILDAAEDDLKELGL